MALSEPEGLLKIATADLDRELFNRQVRGLLARVQQLVVPGSDTEP